MEQKTLVEFSVQDEILIASLDTATISISGIDSISQALREVITQQRPQNLIIDFTRVRFLSSLMLGLLVDIWRRMKEYGGRVRICGIDPQLTRVFRITHLDRIFEFSADPAGAVEAMKSNG
jgi:anti-sigma B factor antagonist